MVPRSSRPLSSSSQTVPLKRVVKGLYNIFKEKGDCCQARKAVNINEFMSGNNNIN